MYDVVSEMSLIGHVTNNLSLKFCFPTVIRYHNTVMALFY